jgi:hypothetical protein
LLVTGTLAISVEPFETSFNHAPGAPWTVAVAVVPGSATLPRVPSFTRMSAKAVPMAGG